MTATKKTIDQAWEANYEGRNQICKTRNESIAQAEKTCKESIAQAWKTCEDNMNKELRQLKKGAK